VSAAAADALIDRHGPEVVLAAVTPLLSDERLARIDAVLAARLESLTCVLEDVYDPHNGAAAIRSLEAFGVSEVHAVEAANPFPVATAVTIGADKRIDVRRHPDVDACAAALRERGFALCATTPEADTELGALDMTRRWAIWFGNEREGLSARAVDIADARVAIDMHGFTRSFNLSVSVALVVRELAARRRAAIGARGDLDADRALRLRARFAAMGVRGLDGVVDRFVSG
jgi:tRNA (guanosine-2'-O-)-methyltransferase